MIADYRQWEAGLAHDYRSLYLAEPTPDPKVVPLLRG
jgi:hypothetical protein